MADPPVYELVDSSGNVVGELRQANNRTELENVENSNPVFIQSLSTDELGTNLQEPNIVTGTRSLDSWYENSDAHNREVIIDMQTDGSSGNQDHSYALITSKDETISSDKKRDGFVVEGGVLTSTATYSLNAEVPPGHSYRVVTFSGNEATISRWVERGVTGAGN